MANETTAPAAQTNEPTHPAVKTLLETLDDVAENARYAADPREASGRIAAGLAAYFRTPD